MTLETKLLIGCFVVLAYGMVLAISRVLGAWVDHHVTRHDLVVESKRRRLEYLRQLAEMDKQFEEEEGDEAGDVIIEQDELPMAA